MQPLTDEYAMLEDANIPAFRKSTPVMDIKASDLRPFLPAKDFDVSKDFYVSLGCRVEWEDRDLALLCLCGRRFYLQRYFVKEWADNSMLYIPVEDAGACYRQIQHRLQSGRHPGARVAAPRLETHGALVTNVWDPSGVLLHLSQRVDAADAASNLAEAPSGPAARGS